MKLSILTLLALQVPTDELCCFLLKPDPYGEENAQQSGLNVILLGKVLAMCG